MIPPLIEMGCAYHTYAFENVVIPLPFMFICGYWVIRVLCIYALEARDSGGCVPYFMDNKLERFDVVLLLILSSWLLSIVGYLAMLVPQPLPKGCHYLKGQWLEVKHEWECQACCACKGLVKDSYFNCAFKDCVDGGVKVTNMSTPKQLELLKKVQRDAEPGEIVDRIPSGDWCWDNDATKRTSKNNCFKRFALDLDRSGSNPLIEQNPEDDFPSCLGHCAFVPGRQFYQDNITTQEMSRQPRCTIVCHDLSTPNNLMVDNIEQFQASGKTYVESKGPQFKFNHSLPMQEPPKLAVDFFAFGTTSCILLILFFTNCFSHRPRNFMTKKALKNPDPTGKRKMRKGDKGIVPEDTDDEEEMNPDEKLATPLDPVPQKLIKNEVVSLVEPSADEVVRARIEALKNKRAGRGPEHAAWQPRQGQELRIMSGPGRGAREGGGGGPNRVQLEPIAAITSSGDEVHEVPQGVDEDQRQDEDYF